MNRLTWTAAALALGLAACTSSSSDDDDDDDDESADDSGWDGGTGSGDGGGTGSGSGSGENGGGSGEDGGSSGEDGSTGWSCSGAQVYLTVDGETELVGSNSVELTLTDGTLTFCSGHSYAADLDVDGGSVTITSDDGRASGTTLVDGRISVQEGSLTLQGLTFADTTDRVLYVDDRLYGSDLVFTGHRPPYNDDIVNVTSSGDLSLSNVTFTDAEPIGSWFSIIDAAGDVTLDDVDITSVRAYNGVVLRGGDLRMTGGSITDSSIYGSVIRVRECGSARLSSVRVSGVTIEDGGEQLVSCECGDNTSLSSGTVSATCD